MLAEPQTQNATTTRGIPVSIVPRAEETPVQSLARQLETYRAINTLVDMLFVEGEDYGIQEGTDQYALKIPGIEKSMGLLGLREEYHDIEVIRDYSYDNPFFYFEVECVLFSLVTGQEVARGQGVCHTREKSFTRQAARKCPKCSAETIFRSKKEGEGWFCWKKEGGCGAQFTEKDPAIISQKVGNIVDYQQVWDGINRARKVANKRAVSSAIRRVAMLSGHFVKRKSNGSTEIRYTPAEIKAMTAQTVTVVAGTPATEQARETMGSGGSRRVDPPKPAAVPVTPEPVAPDAPPAPETTDTTTMPEWYTEARRGYLLNQLMEKDLIPEGTGWVALLNRLAWQVTDCYKFKSGNDMYQVIKPLLEAKKLELGEAKPNPTSPVIAGNVTAASDKNAIPANVLAQIDASIEDIPVVTTTGSGSAFNRGLNNYMDSVEARRTAAINAQLDQMAAIAEAND